MGLLKERAPPDFQSDWESRFARPRQRAYGEIPAFAGMTESTSSPSSLGEEVIGFAQDGEGRIGG